MVCLAAALLAGCPAGGEDAPVARRREASGVVVARVGGQPITDVEVRAQMRLAGHDARRALEELVTFEALARAASDAGYRLADERAAEPARAMRVQRLVERELEPNLSQDNIDEASVRALYERGKKRFVHGRLVQVAMLCVFTGARMSVPRRAAAEATARELAKLVAGRPSTTGEDFAGIAKLPAWQQRNVSSTTVWQADTEPFPAVVGNAVALLKKPGDTTPVVGDETGYYIARYLDEKPPSNVTFEQAAPQLRQQMFAPWRRRQFVTLTNTLAAGHDVEAFPERLERQAKTAEP